MYRHMQMLLLLLKQHQANTMSTTIDPEALQSHRNYLVRYAIMQLRDPHLAEDVVQETLVAAIENRSSFSAQSSQRTWLVGILKHKILDVLRKQAREPQLDVADGESESDLADTLFEKNGHWSSMPQAWAEPEKSMENSHFWETFEFCNQRMPVKTARAFMMREFMDMATEEICQELAISTANCWVLLHRARLALRECLDLHWFGNTR